MPIFLPFDPLEIVIAKVTLGRVLQFKVQTCKGFFFGALARLANFINIMSILKSIIFVVALKVLIHDVED
jgi:hypothetical protein